MASLDHARAHAIVDEIRKKNGGISQADKDTLSKVAPDALQAIYNLQWQLGKATQTLATTLYSRDTRFVFELIQNAEDNNYEKTKSEPFLSFVLNPDQIVVDSNEDGFLEKNVRSICKVGDNTKKEQQGYIGEKGIGFKSVFKVASNVHIQSGPFSFSFEHQMGDSGMGMVTPLHKEPDCNVPPHVRTRITPNLARSTNSEKLINDFSELPDSLLMFLTKIRKLSVVTINASASLSKTIYSYKYDDSAQQGILTKFSEVKGCASQERLYRYHITKKTVTNLPKDTARPRTHQVEVILAFPLDPQSVPVIEQQYVFAYLPVRQIGFSFQIQSDFILQASREDVPSSDWNLAIRQGIALAFQDAVLQFCQHDSLQFQWMRYLPSKSISGDFWPQLLTQIVSLLTKKTPILRPWSGGPLKRPHQLKWQTADCLDQRNNPLFDDLPEELYLNQPYQPRDVQILEQLGVRNVSMSEILARVRADIGKPSSKMKSAATSEDWHTRSAKLLVLPFLHDWIESEQVRKLDLIPLQDGTRVSGISGSIFNPWSGSIPVPTDLGLRLVKAEALTNPDRKAQFEKLDVKDCLPQTVIAKINDRYSQKVTIQLKFSMMHLRYSYWNLPVENLRLESGIHICDHYGLAVHPLSVDIYFESSEDLGPKKLCSRLIREDAVIAPGYDIHLLNPAYLQIDMDHKRWQNLSWEDWLEKYTNVQRVPRLMHGYSVALSDVFYYLIRHRGDKLVGALKEHWSSYRDLMRPEIVDELSRAPVACETVDDTPLKDTYVPRSELKKIAEELSVKEKLPFLKLPSGNVDSVSRYGSSWTFLETFHVGNEADLPFYLDILRQLIHSNENFYSEISVKSKKDLFVVYEAIEKLSKPEDHSKIRNLFTNEKAIYAQSSQGSIWATSTDCVWQAPPFYTLHSSLANNYGYRGNMRLKELFSTVVGIEDTRYSHYLEQIKALKFGWNSITAMSEVYRHIQLDASDESDWANIWDEFEKHNLVYAPSENAWYSPSSCLWTETSRISGKPAIASHYAHLQEFFVSRLRVPKPELSMFVEALIKVADNDSPQSMQKMRDLIHDINSWGPSGSALDRLKLCNILPIRGIDGRLSLGNIDDRFVIIDRRRYGDLFKGRIPVLDFEIEEIHDLRQFILAMSLDDRYMSQAIYETSTAHSSDLDGVLSTKMRQKAHALFRCAVHYSAVRAQDQALYHRLLAANVYRSDNIIRTVTITICGTSISVEGEKGKLHIADDDAKLQLYVPKNEDDQELCYLNQVPERLVSYLKISESSAVKVIGDIVKATRPSLLDRLLEDSGIIRVSGVEPASFTSHNIPLDASLGDDISNSQPEFNHHSPSPPGTSRRESSTSTPTRHPSLSVIARYRARSVSRSHLSPATPSRDYGTPRSSVPPERDEYRDLLGRIIAAAAQASFPSFTDTATATAQNPEPHLDSDAIIGKRSDGQMGRDMKIGAAGELYAFELLLKQNLPAFSRENWKSTIRKEVCVHDRYRNMQPWRGAETADIVYEDVGPDYKFTKLLADLGYPIVPEVQPGVVVKYYLEVKTTTQKCETRFFMSRAQYKRMKKMILRTDQPSSEVYIILRVFNVDQHDVGVRLYLDPASMELDHQLLFDPTHYAVIPGEPVDPNAEF